MTETTQEERTQARQKWIVSQDVMHRLARDADRLARLEDGIRALADEIEADSGRHQQHWRNGASSHYEGRADQAADDADRLRALLYGE